MEKDLTMCEEIYEMRATDAWMDEVSLQSWNDSQEVKEWLSGNLLLEFIGDFQHSNHVLCVPDGAAVRLDGGCEELPF
jgi:hypothetical protein